MARPADPRRRETILRAATEVFTEQGFSETRLADIAQRAGVVISTLYLYFGSMEAMVHDNALDDQHVPVDARGRRGAVEEVLRAVALQSAAAMVAIVA